MADQRIADGGALSPLGIRTFDPVVIAAGVGVEVLEHPFTDQLDVRIDPEPAGLLALGELLRVPIPAEPNRVGRDSRRLALWLAPDQWLVLDPDNLEDDVARLTMEDRWPPDVTFVDVSAHRTLLEIRGRDARALLARGCPLDLDRRVFGPDQCAQTLLARVDVIVFRLDGPDSPAEADSFGVLVRASFARYLAAWLRDAIAGLDA